MDLYYVVGLSGANHIYINVNMAENGKDKFSLKNNNFCIADFKQNISVRYINLIFNILLFSLVLHFST